MIARSHRAHNATLALFPMRDSLRTAAFTIAAISSPIGSAAGEDGDTVATVIPADATADDMHQRFDHMA
jgi:hypothetical protein